VDISNPLQHSSFDTGACCFLNTLVFPCKYFCTNARNPALKLLITAEQVGEVWGSTIKKCVVLATSKQQERKVIVQVSEGYGGSSAPFKISFVKQGIFV
jgi:hypothetical protein